VLDPVLEQFVAPIMGFLQLYVRKAVSSETYMIPVEVRSLFLVLTQLSKVRGYKTVVKFFPHEVSDMEQVTELLHF
jgi:tubulin-specific chaperone D